MDELARDRRVRGPYRIANYMKARFDDAPSGVSVAKWMYGDTVPRPEHVEMFSEAPSAGQAGGTGSVRSEPLLGSRPRKVSRQGRDAALAGS
jgi:hypothetical protein